MHQYLLPLEVLTDIVSLGSVARNQVEGHYHCNQKRCAACGGELVQRSDDQENVVRERLSVYHERTAPLVDFYSGRVSFRSLDGSQTPELVESAVSEAVDSAVRTIG